MKPRGQFRVCAINGGVRGPGWAEQEIKDFPKRMLKMMRFGRRQRKEGWI